MKPYVSVTTYGDYGPWISKLICPLPMGVIDNLVRADTFVVYCERVDAKGNVVSVIERPSLTTHPSRGYVTVAKAYVCDGQGNKASAGHFVALELEECELTSRINVTSVTSAEYVENRFRVTQIKALPSLDSGGLSIVGLEFDSCKRTLEPELTGWSHGSGGSGAYSFSFGCFDPLYGQDERQRQSTALIVWLHGASDGGNDVRLPYTGSNVTLLSRSKIQSHFAGGAWVLVPQCPTFWMDDGVEQMGRSGNSIYTQSLKALIDDFIASHKEIDPARIVVGGLSNGGFMTLRLLIDYPGFFAAGIGCCAPLYENAQTPDTIASLSKTPLWLIHSMDDTIVNPKETVIPLYSKLQAAGACDHFTCYDHVEDLTGRYKDDLGNPRKFFGHGVWIQVFNDFCRTELDGTNVLVDGLPVTLWEWAASQRRK